MESNLNVGIVVWASSADYISQRMALLDVALVHARRGVTTSIICIEGYSSFAPYKDRLEQLHHKLIDGEEFFKSLVVRYANLERYYSKVPMGGFFFKNIMRWFVLSHFLKTPILNADADLVINRGTMEILSKLTSYFYYPYSTCFLVFDERFESAYTRHVDLFNEDPENHANYIQSIAISKNWSGWGLNSIASDPIIEEEKFVFFSLSLSGLLSDRAGDATGLTCHPFISAATAAPLGQYLDPVISENKHGIKYSYREDKHFLGEYPMAFVHYQQSFHFMLGCFMFFKQTQIKLENFQHVYDMRILHERLNNNSLDEKFRRLQEFCLFLRYNSSVLEFDYWAMPALVKFVEDDGGLSELFRKDRWFTPNVFI